MYDYRLIREKRKTISILHLSDGALKVRAPLDVQPAQIEEIILRHQCAIENRFRKRKEMALEKANYNMDDTYQPMLFGKNARL